MGYHQFLVLSIMKLVPIVLILSTVTAVLPLSMGCSLDPMEPIIRCRSNNLEYIVKSMYIWVPENRNVNTSADNRTIHIKPTEVDIFYCEVPELSNIFQRFNNSLERIRVARSNVKSITINTFEGLEHKLRYLDLSGNKLLVVPAAIQNLTRLEILNLRDNKIKHLADGPTFSYTKNLREIYLDFNEIGSVDITLIIPPAKNNYRKSNQQTPIGLGLFSLGNTTSTLEVLSLRGNNMHSYPEQFLSDFPHLKLLDLSFNSIVELPEDAFRTMPELQTVNADSNFIRTIKFSSLPETLKVFTFKNNPLRCDCDVKWLLERIFTNTSLQFLLPKCNAPFHLRDTSFLSLTVDKLCNQSHIRRQTVYVNDRDLSYFPQGVFQSLRLLDVRGGFTSIFVSWKVDVQFHFSQREWLIIYRTLDDSIYTFNRTLFVSKSYGENRTDWTPTERIFSDNIKNLTAGTFYQICLSVVENNINYVHLNNCRVTQTEKEVLPSQFAVVEPNPESHDQTTTPAPDPDILIESNLVNIRADVRAITVYWKVFVQTRESRAFYKGQSKRKDNNDTKLEFTPESPLVVNELTAIYNELKWKIMYRKFATEATTAVTIMKNNYVVTGPNTHHYTIANLKAGTGYMVCFETINDVSTTNKGRQLLESGEKAEGSSLKTVALAANETVCKEIETLHEKKLPVTEMAISSTITAGVTVVVVSFLFCVLPRIFKSNKKSEEDAENASQNTVHTDPENDDDDDEDDDDIDSDEDPRNTFNKSNGHLPKGKNSYPKLTNIFPIEDYRNGSYHSSFRNFGSGTPSHPGSQRNGTYPKSILKKSPSAPQLSEAVKPPPILKRPSSVHDDQSNNVDKSSLDSNNDNKVTNVIIEMDKNRPIKHDMVDNHKESAVEMTKIFSPPKNFDSSSESESPS